MNNKSRTGLKNTVIYIICVVLAAFYIWVLWVGQNPNVCIEYKMYYITNELSDWPGYNRLSYKLGTVEYASRYYKSAYFITDSLLKRANKASGVKMGRIVSVDAKPFVTAVGTKAYSQSADEGLQSTLYYRLCKRKGQGWQKNINGSCKIKDKEAYIYYVPVESCSRGSFNIAINSYDGIGTVSIYANDMFLGTITGMGYYSFNINNISKDELLTIKFIADECEFGWQRADISKR